jgi:hypothetical protein
VLAGCNAGIGVLTLVADENLKQQITNGLRRRLSAVDIVSIRQAGLAGHSDRDVLAWAADEGRIVVTHDTRTMAGHAYNRVTAGEPMAGVVEVPDTMPIGQAIDEILLVVQLMEPHEIKDRVLRLPL